MHNGPNSFLATSPTHVTAQSSANISLTASVQSITSTLPAHSLVLLGCSKLRFKTNLQKIGLVSQSGGWILERDRDPQPGSSVCYLLSSTPLTYERLSLR